VRFGDHDFFDGFDLAVGAGWSGAVDPVVGGDEGEVAVVVLVDFPAGVSLSWWWWVQKSPRLVRMVGPPCSRRMVWSVSTRVRLQPGQRQVLSRVWMNREISAPGR
jgi:hypothetical protein